MLQSEHNVAEVYNSLCQLAKIRSFSSQKWRYANIEIFFMPRNVCSTKFTTRKFTYLNDLMYIIDIIDVAFSVAILQVSMTDCMSCNCICIANNKIYK